jgi:hypothetical protein
MGILRIAGALLASAVMVSCGGGGGSNSGSGDGSAPVSVAPSIPSGSVAAVARLDGNALPDPGFGSDFTVAADNVHHVYYMASGPGFRTGSGLRLVRIEASGKVTPVAGPWNHDTCEDNWCPRARIATDGMGNLYVFWPAAPFTAVPTLYKLDADGNVLSTVELRDQDSYQPAGSSEVLYAYRFADTRLMAVDRQGNVSILDGKGVLWRIGSDGAAKRLAGSGPWPSYDPRSGADGTGASANFRGPTAMTADESGSIYVADYSRLRKVTSEGVVTTLPVDAQVVAAGTDAAGNIYVPQDMCSGQTVAPSGEVKTIALSPQDPDLCRLNTSLAAFAMTPHGWMAIVRDDVITPPYQRTPVNALLIFGGL